MHVIIQDSNKFGALSEHRLQEVEAQLGYPVPREYSDFLLTHNDGAPERNGFVIADQQGSSILQWLYGIHNGPAWASLLHAWKVYRNRLPAGWVPIGHDGGGNLVCIALGPENQGRIYFWDHESENQENTGQSFKNIYLLAENFSEFLEKLVPITGIEVGALEAACQEGNLELIKQYINAGGDVNRRNEHGQALTRIAAMYGQVEILHALIEQGADFTGALSSAAQNGQARTIEYLLARGADTEEILDSRADTPLMRAASFGHKEAVATLITHGAAVNTKNQHGQTALLQASWAEHRDVIDLLKKAGAH